MEKEVNPRGGRNNRTTIWNLLRYIVSGYDRKYACEALHISTKRFYKLRKELREEGYLDATWAPTKKGNEKGLTVVYTGGEHATSASHGKKIRLHRVQIKLPIFRWWKKPEPKKIITFGRNGSASYWISEVKECTVKVFNNILDCYLGEFWGDSPEDCDKQMLKWFLEWVPLAEEALGCRVRKEEGLATWVIVKREYAHVGAQNAKIHYSKREVIRVRDENGELRYVVDHSMKDDPEFESVHPTKSPADARFFEEAYNDIASGKWRKLKQVVGGL